MSVSYCNPSPQLWVYSKIVCSPPFIEDFILKNFISFRTMRTVYKILNRNGNYMPMNNYNSYMQEIASNNSVVSIS